MRAEAPLSFRSWIASLNRQLVPERSSDCTSLSEVAKVWDNLLEPTASTSFTPFGSL